MTNGRPEAACTIQYNVAIDLFNYVTLASSSLARLMKVFGEHCLRCRLCALAFFSTLDHKSSQGQDDQSVAD